MLLALLIASAAQGSIAFATTPPAAEPVRLSSGPQLRELCTALRCFVKDDEKADPAVRAETERAAFRARDEALSRTFRVEVPAKGFSFGRYRPQEQLLELDGDRPLRALDGWLLLDLEGIDDVAFDATPAQVAAWSQQKKDGDLRLVVVWRLAGEPCAGNPSAGSLRVAGKALSWQLAAADGTPLAAADAEGEPVAQARRRDVEVQSVVYDDEERPGDEGRGRLSSLQPALAACASASRGAGSLVVAFGLQAGRVREPQIILDSVRDETVARCVAQALRGALLPAARDGRGIASLRLR